MARKPRTPQDAANNYVSGTSAKAAFWKQRAGQADWQSSAGSDQAESNYATGVQAAVTKKSRKSAILATPNSVYQSGINAADGRYAQGAAAAAQKVQAALTKIMADIAAVPLPPRGPRGSSVNITQRGTAIQTALAAKRGMYKVRGIGKTVPGV